MIDLYGYILNNYINIIYYFKIHFYYLISHHKSSSPAGPYELKNQSEENYIAKFMDEQVNIDSMLDRDQGSEDRIGYFFSLLGSDRIGSPDPKRSSLPKSNPKPKGHIFWQIFSKNFFRGGCFTPFFRGFFIQKILLRRGGTPLRTYFSEKFL